MNWLKKLPQTQTSASGLEWKLWRKLPLITLVGTLVPFAALLGVHVLSSAQTAPADARWLQTLDYMVIGAVIFHWTVVATLAIGCVIIMVMKGPGYVADGYNLPHSDLPRATMQTEREAAGYRSP
jgi:hypothetical protein